MADGAETRQWRETLDREGVTPLYRQLEEIVRGEIARGEREPGDLLPSESELCERWDVSRTVVRQALNNLASDGVIRTERGRGSFVSEPKLHERFVQRAVGFYEDLSRMGLSIDTEVIRQDLSEAPIEVGRFLGVDRALRLDRLRSVNGRTLAYVVTYLSPDRCPGLLDEDLTDRSLYELLRRRYSLEVHSGYRTVEAVSASEDVADHLGIEPGAPVLLLRSAGRTDDGRPLEWFEAWHRADRTRFEVEIVPGERSRPLNQRIVEPGSGAAMPPMFAAPAARTRHPALVWEASALKAALDELPVVAVLRATRYGAGDRIAAGLTEGGIRAIEFTLTGENALEAITQARRIPDAVVGAGSVTDAEQARRAVGAGAQFVVCPICSGEVATAGLGVPVVLAGSTPTELYQAWQLTHGPVKLFPVSGPSQVAAIRGPLPQIPLVPSGGIDGTNVRSFLDAGSLAVNVGSSLCPPAALETADREMLAERARALVAAVRGGR
jgi:GntR family transcriptional regulator